MFCNRLNLAPARTCVKFTSLLVLRKMCHCPKSSRQDGLLYFKAPRNVQLFGVKCKAIPGRVNYLIEEADTIGPDGKSSHGSNVVVSLLHPYFATHDLGERSVTFMLTIVLDRTKTGLYAHIMPGEFRWASMIK